MTTNIPSEQLNQFVHDCISAEIQRRTSAIIDEEMKQLTERVQKRVRGEVGAIAASVLQRFSMERRTNEILIRVEFPTNP